MPRDWFYRSSVYAVAGGTVFATIFTLVAVYSQPKRKQTNFILDLWNGRVRELSFFGDRFDVKMYFYVVGGTMFSLNALSGTAYHYERFGRTPTRACSSTPPSSPFTSSITSSSSASALYLRPHPRGSRVQAVLGRADRLRVAVHPPLVGHGGAPRPRLFSRVDECLADRNDRAVPVRVGHLARREPAEIHLQAMARAQVPRPHGAPVHRGGRAQDPVQRPVGRRTPFQLHGRGIPGALDRAGLRLSGQPLAWTYFAFIVSMFVWRQIVDDRQCAEKYGPEKWAEYRARVKYRIMPGVY